MIDNDRYDELHAQLASGEGMPDAPDEQPRTRHPLSQALGHGAPVVGAPAGP
jgi:hypothetical protein